MARATAGVPPDARALVASAAPAMRIGGGSGGGGEHEGTAALAFDSAAVKARIRRADGAASAAALAAVDAIAAAVRRAFTAATTALFRWGILLVLAALALTALIPELPLRRGYGASET
jgi:hypothetical protein